MKPVLIFRHVDVEGPGYLADFLHRRGIPHALCCIDQGERPPSDPGDWSGLVFMGGPMSVNDPLEWIRAEIALIKKALAGHIPVLGHCLGGQLIAAALDAKVVPGRVREIGWHPVRRRDTPLARYWFGEEGEVFDCFHWHGETFELPAGATPLLSGTFCEHQAFSMDRTLAMQCHIEMTPEMIAEWTRRFADQLQPPQPSVQTAGQIRRDLEIRVPKLNAIADHVYGRWIEGLTH